MDDIGGALSDSLSRTGLGGMLAPFKNTDGTQAAPGITWTNEPTSGWYRVSAGVFTYAVAGQKVFTISSAGIRLEAGLTAENISGGLKVQDAIPNPLSQGAEWFKSDDGQVLMRYINPDATQTLVATSGAGGDFMPYAERGVANGVATLDASALLTPDERPPVPKRIVFTASGTYTPTAGMRSIDVYLKGGGGAGGGSTVVGYGGGGGEGAETWRMLTAAQVGASQIVVIGAGGPAVPANTNATGGSGLQSSFGAAVLVQALGGAGGTSGTNGGSGGNGGPKTGTGDYSSAGAPGECGSDSGGATIALNAHGGGRGGAQPSASAAVNTGAGGGPGAIGFPSGAGGSGICVITEYF